MRHLQRKISLSRSNSTLRNGSPGICHFLAWWNTGVFACAPSGLQPAETNAAENISAGCTGPSPVFRQTREEIALVLGISNFLQRRARAEQVSIPVNVVDSRDARPEFVIAQPWRGKSGLLACIGPVPLIGGDLPGRVRSIFQN